MQLQKYVCAKLMFATFQLHHIYFGFSKFLSAGSCFGGWQWPLPRTFKMVSFDQKLKEFGKKYIKFVPWDIDLTVTPEQAKLQTPQQKRVSFILRRLAWRTFAIGGPLCLGVCAFLFGRDIIPRYHIYAIKRSYEDRGMFLCLFEVWFCICNCLLFFFVRKNELKLLWDTV